MGLPSLERVSKHFVVTLESVHGLIEGGELIRHLGRLFVGLGRDRIRDTYGDLRRAVHVIELEGPDEAAAAAYAVKQATTDPYQELNSILAGTTGAEDRFDSCYDSYWAALSGFIDTAKSSLQET
ncbi:hypothetical protein ACFW1F_35845 [Streptomyces bungoensis]|uniref:hypothetical protein n=1 Tax=Streptomyces bungoensis TaxID=285568 RepID=UPI0036929F44